MSNGCPLAFFFVLGFPLGVPFSDHAGSNSLSRSDVRSGINLRRAARQPPEPAAHGAKGRGIPPHKPKACKPWKDLPSVCGTFAAGRSNGLQAFRLSSHFVLCPWLLWSASSRQCRLATTPQKLLTVGRRQACNIRAFAARRLKRILKKVFLRVSGSA
jgi:hypothetical protein